MVVEVTVVVVVVVVVVLGTMGMIQMMCILKSPSKQVSLGGMTR